MAQHLNKIRSWCHRSPLLPEDINSNSKENTGIVKTDNQAKTPTADQRPDETTFSSPSSTSTVQDYFNKNVPSENGSSFGLDKSNSEGNLGFCKTEQLDSDNGFNNDIESLGFSPHEPLFIGKSHLTRVLKNSPPSYDELVDYFMAEDIKTEQIKDENFTGKEVVQELYSDDCHISDATPTDSKGLVKGSSESDIDNSFELASLFADDFWID